MDEECIESHDDDDDMSNADMSVSSDDNRSGNNDNPERDRISTS
jgi:hypothetical protein